PAVNNGSLFSCIGQYPCTSFPCYISSWCGSSTVLPVEWTSFTIKAFSDGRLLQWSTGSETNSDLFEIQRSTDGISFSTFATMEAAGNSSQSKHYEFIDKDPAFISGYYRLKQVDFDGKSMYSDILSFSSPDQGRLLFYPNPLVSDVVTVTLRPEPGDQWQLSVVDELGRQVVAREGVMEGKQPLALAITLPVEITQGCLSVQASYGSTHFSERLLVDRK
ncbi:MAG: hypothetical protein ACKO1U_05415, partial [Bacteroidota bacterium]